MPRERVGRLWILHAQSVPRHGLWERRKLELDAKRPSARLPERLARSAGARPRNIEDTTEPQRDLARFAHPADFVDVAFRLGWPAKSSRVTHPYCEQALDSARRQWSGADRPRRARRLLVRVRRRAEQGRPDRGRRRAHQVGRPRRAGRRDPLWLDATRSVARGFWPTRDMDRALPRSCVRRQRLSRVQGDRGRRGADRDPHLFRLSAAHRAGGSGDRPREGHVARRRRGGRGVPRPCADDRRASDRARGRGHPRRARCCGLPGGDPARHPRPAFRRRSAAHHLVLAAVLDGDIRGCRARDEGLAAARDGVRLARPHRAERRGYHRPPRRVRLDRPYRAVPHRGVHESRAVAHDHRQRALPRRGAHAAAGARRRHYARGAGDVSAAQVKSFWQSETGHASRSRSTPAHTRSTKLSTTRFSPALSNWMVSLLPSMAVTLPLPNFWWKTRSPIANSETAPVDLATSSPSMVSGRRVRGLRRAPPCTPPRSLPRGGLVTSSIARSRLE